MSEFVRPALDWHALAPELTLLGVGAFLTLIDIFFAERARAITSALAGLGFLAVLVPIITLASAGVASEPRVMFDGGYVVDGFALLLKAIFVIAGYLVVLLSTNYFAEGDYWENEYYGLLAASTLGMLVMSSANDLITIFIASGTAVNPCLSDGGVAQARPQEQRGGAEVLPRGGGCFGDFALRHVAALRSFGQHHAMGSG